MVAEEQVLNNSILIYISAGVKLKCLNATLTATRSRCVPYYETANYNHLNLILCCPCLWTKHKHFKIKTKGDSILSHLLASIT
jgi:hypothetical protein